MSKLRWSTTPIACVVMLFTFIAVVVFGLLAANSPSWTAGEMRVVVAVNGVHNELFDGAAHAINLVFGTSFAVIVGATTAVAVAIFARSWMAGLRVTLLMTIPWVAAAITKIVVGRARPDTHLLSNPTGIAPTTFSYPSGHTAFAAAWALSLVIILAGWRFRGAVIIGAVAITVVTAWSRVYLGAHYPTDVMASVVLVLVISLCVARVTGRMARFQPGENAHRAMGRSSR
ncbi:phosphatase PAP2 family protein [Microbacterium sp. CJ88]|uniref:phosphatase PAP2 family protein n=1 Tax=Microbacterium sp. CJ88 TaxID=3445672 RepID=UPI003F65A25B